MLQRIVSRDDLVDDLRREFDRAGQGTRIDFGFARRLASSVPGARSFPRARGFVAATRCFT
jgi:hypothetical protein